MNVKIETYDPVIAGPSADEASIEDFLSRVESRLEQGASVVQIDCAQLDRVTSNHINALWQARERCGHRSAGIELVNAGHGLRRVLDVLDLSSLFFPGPPTTIPFKRVFLPTVEQIDEVMSKFVGFLTKTGVPEVTTFELQTVFYEVATNIRRHAGLDGGDPIQFDVQVKDRLAILTFTDNGIPFDPTVQGPKQSLTETTRDKGRKGFGLDMIRRLSDSLEYERVGERRNKLCIRKQW